MLIPEHLGDMSGEIAPMVLRMCASRLHRRYLPTFLAVRQVGVLQLALVVFGVGE